MLCRPVEMQSCDQSHGKPSGTVTLPEAMTTDRFASPTSPPPSCNDGHLLVKSAPPCRTTVASREATVDITSFPVELLSELFSYLVWTRPFEADFLAATHVCRRWRIAAVGNPLLWAHVSAMSFSKAQVFFERSKSVPLSVRISSPDDVEGTLNLLQCHSARVRFLHIETSDVSATAQFLLHLSQMQIPLLESFHLEGPELSLSDPDASRILHALQSRCGQEPWAFPTPLLRHLCIRSLGIPWEASVYQNLSVLDLRTPGMPAPSIPRLLDILRHCPDLESLALQTPMLSETSALVTDGEEMVRLHRLHTFHLDGPSPAQIAEFLKHLILPRSTRYTLSTSIVEAPSQYPVLPADRSHNLPALSSFRAIDFQHVSTGSVLLRCSHTTVDDPLLSITVGGVTDIAAALANVSRAVDVTAAESLSVSLQDATEITSADWYATLLDFTSLSSLRLVGATNNTLRSALGTLWTPLRSRSASIPLPPSPTGSPARSLCEKFSELVVPKAETPCRISTDLLWLCDERKRLGCDVRRIHTNVGYLSNSCVNGLKTRGVELTLYDKQ